MFKAICNHFGFSGMDFHFWIGKPLGRVLYRNRPVLRHRYREVFYCYRRIESCIYEGHLQSSWTQIITSSRKFVEVRWRSLFRSTSLGKRCTSYNAPPTSWNRAADRLSFPHFLPRSSLFMVRKKTKSHGGEIWIQFCVRLRKSGSVELHQNIRHTVQISRHAISGFFQPWKESSEARNFEVINGLQHVFEKWVERCKKCIACQGR
jgi:hypothetical protein